MASAAATKPVSVEEHRRAGRVVFEGYLKLRASASKFARWSRRYFIILPERLDYFKEGIQTLTRSLGDSGLASSQLLSERPDGAISIDRIRKAIYKPKFGSRFLLELDDKTIELRAASAASAKKWVEKLEDTILKRRKYVAAEEAKQRDRGESGVHRPDWVQQLKKDDPKGRGKGGKGTPGVAAVSRLPTRFRGQSSVVALPTKVKGRYKAEPIPKEFVYCLHLSTQGNKRPSNMPKAMYRDLRSKAGKHFKVPLHLLLSLIQPQNAVEPSGIDLAEATLSVQLDQSLAVDGPDETEDEEDEEPLVMHTLSSLHDQAAAGHGLSEEEMGAPKKVRIEADDPEYHPEAPVNTRKATTFVPEGDRLPDH